MTASVFLAFLFRRLLRRLLRRFWRWTSPQIQEQWNTSILTLIISSDQFCGHCFKIISVTLQLLTSLQTQLLQTLILHQSEISIYTIDQLIGPIRAWMLPCIGEVWFFSSLSPWLGQALALSLQFCSMNWSWSENIFPRKYFTKKYQRITQTILQHHVISARTFQSAWRHRFVLLLAV